MLKNLSLEHDRMKVLQNESVHNQELVKKANNKNKIFVTENHLDSQSKQSSHIRPLLDVIGTSR